MVLLVDHQGVEAVTDRQAVVIDGPDGGKGTAPWSVEREKRISPVNRPSVFWVQETRTVPSEARAILGRLSPFVSTRSGLAFTCSVPAEGGAAIDRSSDVDVPFVLERRPEGCVGAHDQ